MQDARCKDEIIPRSNPVCSGFDVPNHWNGHGHGHAAFRSVIVEIVGI